jgi:tRNA (guanine37-N1)-methyltransferase
MRFDVVTIFPDMFGSVAEYGVTGRAVKNGLLQIYCWNPRDYAQGEYRAVDDRPYGGGPGMVMMARPLEGAIEAVRKDVGAGPMVICLSPQGELVDQKVVEELSGYDNLVLLAGRYEGIDERVVQKNVDREYSIGNYVISGGELAAMVLIDAVARQLPGVLGNDESACRDSFVDGLLDCPHYTRPEDLDGKRVPEVLLSGDHAAIRRWRLKQSLGRTWLKRPELLVNVGLDAEKNSLLEEFIDEYELEQKQ